MLIHVQPVREQVVSTVIHQSAVDAVTSAFGRDEWQWQERPRPQMRSSAWRRLRP